MRENRSVPFFPFFLFVLLILAAWTCGCPGCSPPNGTGTPLRPEPAYDWADPQLPSRLQEALRIWAEDYGLYGAAAAVLTPGWLAWSGSYGVQNIDTQELYEADTLGRVASATKPFTSTLILQLVDQGLLTLDTTLSHFVPDYPNGENIQIDHLLRHRSGIPEVQLVDGFFILSILLLPQRWIPPRKLLEWTYIPLPILDIHAGKLVPREPVSEPGGDYHYSQPGYVALGYIIEQVTGKELADVYHEQIMSPLGMAATRLPRRGDSMDPAGYTDLFGLLDEKVPGDSIVDSANALHSAVWSAGGMLSTAQELVTFLSAMLEGSLFSEEALACATDWRSIGPSDFVGGREYGMGLYRHQGDDYTTIGHDGALPGGGSVMQYIVDLDVYVGAVTNTDLDWMEAPDLVERVRDALLNRDQLPQ